MNMEDQNNLWEKLSGILIRCFFLSLALLFFWFGFYVLGGDLGYTTHSKWFSLSRHDYDLLNYYGMAFVKICAILFFLFPHLSMRLVLRRKQKT